MLRAAYFAQELLSTFSTALGEVALQPATGGRFVLVPIGTLLRQVVTLSTSTEEVVIWDRKEKGGFPGMSLFSGGADVVETKVLKQLVRDVIQPDRDLGHSDKKGNKKAETIDGETSLNGKEDVRDGAEKTINIPERKSEKQVSTGADAASQFREKAEQACEDCQ